MANVSYSRFDDDEKVIYKYSEVHQRDMGEVKIDSPIYCIDDN